MMQELKQNIQRQHQSELMMNREKDVGLREKQTLLCPSVRRPWELHTSDFYWLSVVSVSETSVTFGGSLITLGLL